MNQQNITVSVAFATPRLQKIISISIAPQSTILEVINASKLNNFFPEYDFTSLAIGIFGKRIYHPHTHIVQDGERIEIYRPLTQSPNQKRLDRAKNQK
jgi:putative ubiquitin-RnfH superfamily antitoxin RatB of RatAB toxin-antitoxin module